MINAKKINTLITGDYHKQWFDQFNKLLNLEQKGFSLTDGSKMVMLDQDILIQALNEKEIFIVGYDKVTKEVIQQSPDLKMILSIRDGPEENVDINACTEAGIPVISSAGRCSVSVAEFTFLLMLLLARPVLSLHSVIEKDGWTKDNSRDLRVITNTISTELFYKKLGIIGFGRNARNLAKLAKAFGMQVYAADPYVDEKTMEAYGVEKVSIETLCQISDYVTVLARLTPETVKLLSRDLIFTMKPEAAIINTGRALLVDNEAILDALEQNVIKCAALDVHEIEPIGEKESNRIYDFGPEKLIITPHAAGVTKERSWHQYNLLYEQLNVFLSGQIPEGCVNPQVFDNKNFKDRGGVYFTSHSDKEEN